MDVTVIFTCFNRKEKTIKCVKSLIEGNKTIDVSFIIVDDNSTDGTIEALKLINNDICIINGNGNLFWSGGMRVGIDKYFQSKKRSDYVLLVNDDVEFNEGIIEKMITRSKSCDNSVVVGATNDNKGNFTYGALKLIEKRKRDLYTYVYPNREIVICDTFNANCVLIKDSIIRDVGNFDTVYRHALADLDYGFMIKRKGYKIISSDEFVGICYKNSNSGSWRDTSLSRLKRLRKKESIKGSPFKEWFYFMNKNFGLKLAIRYSITPYIRIILKK